MPNWKKLITSGSNASLASLTISTGSSNALVIEGSGSTIFDVQGSQGQLFSITDSLTGTLFSVNDISGIPILEVDSNGTVSMGTFGAYELVVNSGGVTGSAFTGSFTGDGSGLTGVTATGVSANSVALGTDTTGNYVATITGGTGISSTGATSGEGIAHTLSISDNGVDNTKLADMAASTIKGKTAGSSGNPEDLTAAQVRTIINVADGANNYSLPEATSTVRGGIELFSDTDQSVAANSVSSTAGRTYGIQLNSAGQAVVNVPWTDTDTVYTLPEATSTVRGGIELFSDTDQSVAANAVSSTAGRTYGIQLNSDGQAVVNVPWTDSNTTYTAGTGLDLSGTQFSVDVSDFMTNGTNNRVITATGTDGMNAEANLTFDGSTLSVTGGANFSTGVTGSSFTGSFIGDGSGLTGLSSAAITSYTSTGNNRIITSVDATSVQGEANLTFDGSTFSVTGTGNFSGGVTGSSFTGSFVGDGSGLTGIAGGGGGGSIFAATGSIQSTTNDLQITGSVIITSNLTVEGRLIERSTRTLKENIQPLGEELTNVEKLNPVSFDWIESGKSDIGFIAEELNEVYPLLVTKGESGDIKGLHYTKLTSILVKAVQELSSKNKELESRVEKLETRLRIRF